MDRVPYRGRQYVFYPTLHYYPNLRSVPLSYHVCVYYCYLQYTVQGAVSFFLEIKYTQSELQRIHVSTRLFCTASLSRCWGGKKGTAMYGQKDELGRRYIFVDGE